MNHRHRRLSFLSHRFPKDVHSLRFPVFLAGGGAVVVAIEGALTTEGVIGEERF